MNKEQHERLTTVKENLELIQNACQRVQSDVERAETADTDEKAELLIALAEKELSIVVK